MDEGEIAVIDCPTKEMWADVMTKPLQGMAFRVMRVELMNCALNYEDAMEETGGKERKPTSVYAPKSVTWKSEIASPFQTPQECVGQGRDRVVPCVTRGEVGVGVKRRDVTWKRHARG